VRAKEDFIHCSPSRRTFSLFANRAWSVGLNGVFLHANPRFRFGAFEKVGGAPLDGRTVACHGGDALSNPRGAGLAPSFGTTVVLNVQDCHAACAELRRRGVRCDDPQVFPGFVTFASFYDPFGNRLQMCSPAPR
jgi:hypothetical protein